MDGHKVVVFSATVVTLWGIFRLLASSTVRRGARNTGRLSPASTAPPPPTPQRSGTFPTPPTPAAPSHSPVPTLQTPPTHQPSPNAPAPKRNSNTPSSPQPPPQSAPQNHVHEPTERRMPETPQNQQQKHKEEDKTHEPESKDSVQRAPPKSIGKKQANNNNLSLQLSADSHVERIDCATLASWLTKGEHPILVDVRSDDYKGGNVAGAKHMSYAQFKTGKDFLEELQPTKGAKIVFFCMYGKEQSPAVAQAFFQACDPTMLLQVYVLHGGFQAWLRYCARADLSTYINDYNQELWDQQDGGLVYRADVEAPSLLKAPSLRHMRMQSSTLRLNLDENHRFEFLDCTTLAQWLATNDKPVIVDVRSEDFKGGNITGAMHIPFASFSTRIEEVEAALRENTGERQNVVVFYCLFGEERSPTCAMKFLTKHTNPAIKVYVLRRGFQEWLNMCMQSTPMSADRVVAYDPEKWIRQDKLGYVYKSNYAA